MSYGNTIHVRNRKKKDLDLVIARPSSHSAAEGRTLADLASQWSIVLDKSQRADLEALPTLVEGNLSGSGTLLALEAKAAMTAHSKARPRLYDELNSSHLTVHGASTQAIAVGLVMVNAAARFKSPEKQSQGNPENFSVHKQPQDAEKIISKIHEIKRRAGTSGHGFDGLGIVVVEVENDGSPVRLVSGSPAPKPGEVFYYDDMISRVSHEYDVRFAAI